MAETVTVHECLFCPQTFSDTSTKDDHILRHFSQETCTDCNQILIRIGSRSFILHDAVTCTKRTLKSEHIDKFGLDEPINEWNIVESESNDQPGVECSMDEEFFFLKTEPLSDDNPFEQSNIANERNQYTNEQSNIHKQMCNISIVQLTDTVKQIEILQIKPHSFETRSNSSGILKNKYSSIKNRVVCDICGKKLSCQQSLKTHKILKHSSRDTIFCNHCGRLFSIIEERDEHWRECVLKGRLRKSKIPDGERKKITDLWCSLCKTKFITRDNLRDHMQKHLAEIEMYKCHFCPAVFAKESSFKIHNCKKQSTEKFFCSSCHKSFSSIEKRDIHKTKCFSSEERSTQRFGISDEFECYLCRKKCTRWHNLRKHMIGQHFPGVNQFKCNVCNQVYMMESSLRVHLCNDARKSNTKVQNNRMNSVEMFSQQSNDGCSETLNKGMQTLSTIEQVDHVQTFHYPQIKTEESEQKSSWGVECDICGKIISSQKNLKAHKVSKHSSPDTIFCNQCRKVFTNIEERDVHWRTCVLKKRLRKSEIRNKQNNETTESDSNNSRNLWCCLCKTRFQTNECLQNHMQIHLAEIKMFKCQFCCAVFSKESFLQVHNCRNDSQYTDESTMKRVECDICGKTISSQKNLKIHKVLKHSSPDTIFCNQCRKVFTNIEERDVHWRSCLLKRRLRKSEIRNEQNNETTESDSNHSRNLWCCLCKTGFQTNECLQNHMQIHLAEIKMFKCQFCCAVFSKQSFLRVHNCQKTQFYCKNCRKSFPNIEKRDVHMTKCFSEGKFIDDIQIRKFEIHDEFECYLCKSKIRRLADLRRHMRGKHHPGADKFTCKICHKVFMMESTLQFHQCKKPTSSPAYRKPIPCDICGKILMKGSLYYHRNKSHSPAGTIICRFCPKIFQNVENLKAHESLCKKRVHVQHTCEKCGKILSSRSSYIRHNVWFHSKPGTIFCKICVRKFNTNDELKIHQEKCCLKDKLRRYKRNDNETRLGVVNNF